MSETETNRGVLVPVKLINGESNEGYAFRILEGKKEEYNKTYLDQLMDDCYKEYILHNGVLYRCEGKRDLDGGDIFEATKNPDGSINYLLQYYNGGCSFAEAMGYALDKLK